MALSLQQVSNASLASHGAGRLNARLAPLLRLRQVKLPLAWSLGTSNCNCACATAFLGTHDTGGADCARDLLPQDARHIAAKPSDTSGEGGSLSDIDEAWHRWAVLQLGRPQLCARPWAASKRREAPALHDRGIHRFKKEVASQVEIKDRGAAVAPPASGGSPAADAAGGSRSAKDDAKRRAAPRPPPLSPKQEQLRRQESVLLDLWTSQDALRWAAVAVVAALALVLVVSGPPE